jgi:N,N'-diacetyllegionaminate synthase
MSGVRFDDLGRNQGCLIIGEVAQGHDGSLGIAHAFIDAIANAGADAVKFQTHFASAESTPAEPWRVKFSLQDATRYDYWRRMEFTEEQWVGLKRHADERRLQFLSSPFSMEAVDLLDRVGVSAWKVASGEITNIPMFERMAKSRLPFLISTGMSTLKEIDDVVKWVRDQGLPLVLLQSTSEYPCSPERVGLNLIPFFKERYGCPVGLSDHSGTIYPGLAATLLGIAVLEVHVTLSREMFGPDNQASITTGELRQLVEGIHFIEKMLANPVDKNTLALQLAPLRKIFTKSVVAGEDLAAGTVLRKEHLSLKKPGTGIAASRLKELIGRRLLRNVIRDEMLLEDDLEEVD